MLKFAFAGTPEFARVHLEALIKHGWVPSLVLSQPDRPKGRGQKLTSPEVVRFARTHDLPVVQSPVIDQPLVDHVRAHNLDVLVVVAYGLLLPQAMLEAPRLGALNVHASLLPRWRGAAPIERAILAGDQQTGVCVQRMVRKLDAGPVLAYTTHPVAAHETAAELRAALSMQGAKLLIDLLVRCAQTGSLPDGDVQGEDQASYAAKITKSERLLDPWNHDATRLARHVRALDGCWLALESGERLVVERAVVAQDTSSAPGCFKQDKTGVLLGCAGSSTLRLLTIKRAGKASTDAETLAAWLKGQRCLPAREE